MPDHVHVLLTPSSGISVERAVQFIKGGFSYRLRKAEKMQVWQESFTNHRIGMRRILRGIANISGLNPVRAGLVRDARGLCVFIGRVRRASWMQCHRG